MHLRQVKISGFKSFADPTVIEFPGGFVGIVGPNGCGKSNIIDAVRWVMGEGRAGELRATSSMQELIFQGSDDRAPSGRASVEIVLDNSDGTLTGLWGAYAEISVKRTLTRDNASGYFINGQAVRRRDVQDIFMGTGLGPRSYAIISQGMVSSFVKAKPEELRVYFEEAAGVSRYKERRKEAESRLAATRQNLDRAADLQAVRASEIERLSAEAEVADRWRRLTQRRDRLAAVWLALQERDTAQARDRLRAEIASAEAELEQSRAKSAALTREAEALGARLDEARREEARRRDRVNALAIELTRMRSAVSALMEKKKMLADRVSRDNGKLERIRSDSAQYASAAEGFEREASEKEALARALGEAIAREEQAVSQARLRWEEAREAARRGAELEKETQRRLTEVNFKIQSLLREKADLEDRVAALRGETEASGAPDPAELREAEEMLEESEAVLEEQAAMLEDAEEALESASAAESAALERKEALAGRLGEAKARLAAQREAQSRALAESKLPGWLAAHGLAGRRRLLEGVRIEPGFERAVEAALSARVTALCVGSLSEAVPLAAGDPPARLALVEEDDGPGDEPPAPGTLAEKVSGGRPGSLRVIRRWLSRFRPADTLQEAIGLSASGAEVTAVTREGHTAVRGSVLLWAPEGASSGMLEREALIAELGRQISEFSPLYSGCLDEVLAAGKRREEAQAAVSRLRQSLSRAKDDHYAAGLRKNELKSRLELWQKRSGQIARELEAAGARIEAAEKEGEELEARFEELDAALSEASQSAQDAEMAEESARGDLARAEQQTRDSEGRVRLTRAEAAHARQRAADARRSCVRFEAEEADLIASIEEARAEAEEIDEQAAEEGLQGVLAGHEEADRALSEATRLTAELSGRIAETQEAQRREAAAERPAMERIGELRVKQGSLENELQVFSSQLSERRADRLSLLAEAQRDGWKAAAVRTEIGRLERAADALGAVNHAALEHLEAARKAMEACESQMKDLQSAIETLEEVIRRIDSETRSVLRSTFDAVNANFSDLFRRIFSGGRASLEMTGDEVLQCGIEIKAQPPGKKNASVRMLSGGEQALTATALVFALFKLNPAPFCLLDEVDAPLDEANQLRLSRLILSMSSATQFVAITHHRVTMEAAGQLIGVTMREPGVSRVVSVDIGEAVSYARRQH